MASRLNSWKARWEALRERRAFQIALVFGGAAWLVLQAADVVGAPLGLVRALAVILLLVFAGLLGVALLAARERRPAAGVRVRRRGRLLLIVATALLVLGTAAWWARLRLQDHPVKPAAEIIAVLPFATAGDAVLVLGEGMVDLLSKNLDGVGGIRVIDPRTALFQWRRRGGAQGLDLKAELDVGRTLEAGSILTGSVVAAGKDVRLTGDLIGVDGKKLANAQVSGAIDSVLPLVDRLSTALLRDIWRAREPLPAFHVEAITTTVNGALRAYLRGEQFYRRSQWDSAALAFQEAVRQDSTFALAHFRLGMSAGWLEAFGSPTARQHAQAAVRHADRLPPRERALMVAQELHEAGNLAALDTLEAYVRRYPNDADGWQYYGDVQFHASPLLGEPYTSAMPAFDRAIALDPSAAPAYVHQLDAAMMTGDSTRFDHYLQGLASSAAPEGVELYRTVRRLRWGPDTALLPTIAAALRGSVGATNASSQMLVGSAEVRAIEAAQPDAAVVLKALDDTLFALMAFGRPGAAAGAAFERFRTRLGLGELKAAGMELDTALQANREFARWATLFLFTGLVPPETGARVLELLPPGRAPTVYWKTVAALAGGDSTTARALLASPLAADSAYDPAVPRSYFDALRAWTTVTDGDTTNGLPQLRRALTQAGYDDGSLLVLRAALIALARTEASRPKTRQRGIARMRDLTYRYPVATIGLNLPLAQALEAEGRMAEAAAAYARLLSLWRDADPELQPWVATARRGLERITHERRQN